MSGRPVRRLRRALGRVRRILPSVLSVGGIAAGLGLLGGGWLRPQPGRLGPLLLGVGLSVGLLAGQAARRVWRAARRPDSDADVGGDVDQLAPRQRRLGELRELEAGATLVLSTYLLLQILSGARSPLHPLVYALSAFLFTGVGTRVAVGLLGFMLLSEALLLYGDGLLWTEPARFFVHGAFLLLFGVLHWLFLRGEVLRQRREHRRRIDGELQRMKDEAFDYRLLSAQLPQGGAAEAGDAAPLALASPRDSQRTRPEPIVGSAPRSGAPCVEHSLPVAAHSGARRQRPEEEVILSQGSVLVIKESQRATLELLRRALDLHTAALFWLDGGGDTLKLKESSGPAALLRELAADAGALGTALKTRRPLRLSAPKPGHLPYYEGARAPAQIGSVLALPLIDEALSGSGPTPGAAASSDPSDDRPRRGGLRGVLCVDRLLRDGAPVPFQPEEEALLLRGAEQLLRSLQSERVFAAVERSKYEQERLFAASERLNRALTPEQVHETTFLAAGEICAFDFAAITSYDREGRRHQVVAVDGRSDKALAERLQLLQFADNAGLLAMALKNRHPLPRDGVLRDSQTPIFDDAGALPGMASLLVLPLISGGEAVGGLVLAGARPGIFSHDKRGMLGVLANQVAVSLENARMYKAMEAMATTDGLTGLTNRRAFNDRFAEMLQRAERQGKSLTLLMTDIDHFKKVNDTYGHPVGDAVLKRVAQVVQANVRKIDLAARYGGEEFAVVLEMTDRAGARQLAERVRVEVSRLQFQSDKGPFQCTLSLGMATFPADGPDSKTLTAHADQALYHAKHNGRNRAVAYEDMAEPRRAAG